MTRGNPGRRPCWRVRLWPGIDPSSGVHGKYQYVRLAADLGQAGPVAHAEPPGYPALIVGRTVDITTDLRLGMAAPGVLSST